MQINLSSQEILALHNLLHSNLSKISNSHDVSEDEFNLNQVYIKLKQILLNKLSGVDGAYKKFESWEQREKVKLQNISNDNRISANELLKIKNSLNDY